MCKYRRSAAAALTEADRRSGGIFGTIDAGLLTLYALFALLIAVLFYPDG